MSDDSLAGYFRWFRASTEEAWRRIDIDPIELYESEGSITDVAWQRNTIWQTGLDEREIDEIETSFGIKFPADYRLFLEILNAPDRGVYGTKWSENRMLERAEDRPSFYDWRKHGQLLKAVLREPLDGLIFDVEHNGLWRDSWGERPPKVAQREQRLAELFQLAPRLIPIIGHRYLVMIAEQERNPVLSVVQSDIIVYGSDLRSYLEDDFSELLNPAATPPPPDLQRKNATNFCGIPFWGELIQ